MKFNNPTQGVMKVYFKEGRLANQQSGVVVTSDFVVRSTQGKS